MEKSEKKYMDDLAAILASKWDITKKEAQQFLTDFIETVKEGVNADGQLKIKGLGTFKVIGVDARESVNVNTGERVLIESHQKLTFTPDALMKELVNKPFSHFETVVLNDGVDFPNEPEDTEDTEGTEETENTETTEAPIVETPTETQEVVAEEPQETQEVVAEEPEEPQEPEEVVSEPEEIEEPQEPEEPQEVVSEPEEPQQPEEPQEEEVSEPEEPEEEPQEVTTEPKSDEKEVIPEKVQPVAPLVSEPVEEQEKSSKGLLWLLLALLACGLSFGAGYWLGGQNKAEATAAEETTVAEEATVTDNPVAEEATATDSINQEVAVADKDTIAQPEVTKPVEPKAATGEQEWQKYDAMDQRIRLGYYAIVGLDREVEAKEGETLARLSRRILGPDMVCYVEAYNGMKASDVLTAGQIIKIPKLVSKKKAKEMNKGNE